MGKAGFLGARPKEPACPEVGLRKPDPESRDFPRCRRALLTAVIVSMLRQMSHCRAKPTTSETHLAAQRLAHLCDTTAWRETGKCEINNSINSVVCLFAY